MPCEGFASLLPPDSMETACRFHFAAFYHRNRSGLWVLWTSCSCFGDDLPYPGISAYAVDLPGTMGHRMDREAQ